MRIRRVQMNDKKVQKKYKLKGKTHRISINCTNDATVTLDNKNRVKSMQIKGTPVTAATFNPVKWNIDEALYTFSSKR